MAIGTTRSRLSDLALTALRVGVGAVMMVHGWQKLTDAAAWQQTVASMNVPFPEVMGWLGIVAELGGGIALILGVLTPLAAAGIVAMMTSAIVLVHWGNGLLAQNNGFELPLLIGLAALYLMIRGAGPLSIDAMVRRGLSRRKRASATAGSTSPTTVDPTTADDNRIHGREYAGAAAR